MIINHSFNLLKILRNVCFISKVQARGWGDSVKHLPYKQEDLNANSDSHVKKPQMVACNCNLSTGEVETDSRSLRLDGQLV